MALGTPAALGAVCEHPLCWGVTGCPPRCWLAGAGDAQLPPAPLTPLSPQAQRHVNDLYEDLRDGHNLISLLEVLSGDTLVGATLPCPALFPTPRHAPVPLRRPSSSSSSSSPSLPASVPSLPAWPSVCPSDPRAPAPPAPASNLSLLWCPLCFLAPAPAHRRLCLLLLLPLSAPLRSARPGQPRERDVLRTLRLVSGSAVSSWHGPAWRPVL